MSTVPALPPVDTRMAEENVRIQRALLVSLQEDLEEATAAGKAGKMFMAADIINRHMQTVAKAEDELQRLRWLQDARSYWAQRAEELATALDEQYGGRGPQYEILIKRVVFAELQAERTERSGRLVDGQEWRALSKTVLDAVQALQRYTESQKTEIIRTEQQRAMLVVLETVEHIIAPQHPELWMQVVEEVQKQLPDGEEVA